MARAQETAKSLGASAAPGVDHSVMKTKVVNKTGKLFRLKEGTAGVYRLLKTLKPGEWYIISFDPNATYREYWCAVNDDDPKPIILSSDDCQEYSEVRITETSADGTSQEPSISYSWNGDLRDLKRQVGQQAAPSAAAPAPAAASSAPDQPQLQDQTPNDSFIVKLGKVVSGFCNKGSTQA